MFAPVRGEGRGLPFSGELLEKLQVKLPFIDRIWRVESSLPLEEPLLPEEVFDRLDPLFQANGTSYEIDGDTLTFSKHNPAAQDKLATFTRGKLRVVGRGERSELAYDLTSPALLACFLAPLLFLAFAQITIAIGELEKPATEAARESAEEDDEEKKELKLHPIDIALGAPEPKDPDEKEDGEDEKKDKKHSPTAAYILAAIFATLYVVGRILEPWLIKSTFRKALSNSPALSDADTGEQTEARRPG
jgi:hypothetical protein